MGWRRMGIVLRHGPFNDFPANPFTPAGCNLSIDKTLPPQRLYGAAATIPPERQGPVGRKE